MRKLSLLLVLPLVAAWVYGCDQQTPTGPVANTTAEAPLFSAEILRTNFFIPNEFDIIVPCALDGAGEEAHLSGPLHVLTYLVTDDEGGLHVGVHLNSANVQGVGLTSGDTYRGA